jgi:hypothetical protein
MDFNFGIKPPQSKEAETLYRLAYQCVHLKATMRCNMCPNCTYNIFNYGWQPSEAKLIKARALVDYNDAIAAEANRKSMYKKTEFALCVGIGAVILFIILAFWVTGLLDSLVRVPLIPDTQPATLSIENTIQQVKSTLRDVNKDNKINCIDYTIVFYELYPGSRIIRVWDNDKLNHMLSKVGERYVEPQRSDGDPNMWPTFKTAHKKDVTDDWNYLATKKQW